MNLREKLKAKLEKIDLSSLSDEQVKSINTILEKPVSKNKAGGSLFNVDERHRNIFENIQSVYFETALDSTILDISSSVEVITKHKREELIGTKAYDLYVNKDDREKILQQHLKAKDGKLRNYHVDLLDKDGSTLHCSLNAQIVRNKDGVPVKIIGSFIDITQLHKTIEALTASEEKYRNIFDNIQTVYFEANTDSTIIDISSSVEIITKHKREELIGAKAHDLYYNKDEREKVIQQLSGSKDGKLRDYYLEVKDKDGAKLQCSFNAQLIKNKEGIPVKIIGSFVDLTKLYKTIDALTTSEERYRNIFENIEEVYYETSMDGTILEICPSVEYFTKYKYEELIGRDVFDAFYYKGDKEKLVQKLVSEGKLRDYFIEIKDKDGAKFQGLLNAKLVKDNNKKQAKIIGAIRDITELQKTINALIASEEKYRNIFENIQTVYYESTLDGTLLEISPSVEYYSKYKREELIGTNAYDLYYNIEDKGKSLQLMTSDGIIRDFYIDIKDKDGSKLKFSLNAKLIKNNDGVPEKFIGAIINITELHKTLNALKISEEKYREIYENAQDIIWTSDLEGNFISMNPVSEKIMGYKFEEEINPSIKKYLTPESYKIAIDNILKKINKEESTSTYEVEAIAKNGKSVFLEISSYLKYENDKPVGIFGIARDITERKKAESELSKTREKYIELFESTNDIVYTMDFNGNFTSVNPMAEKLLGYKFEEITKLNMSSYISPETAKVAFDNIAKKLRGEATNTLYEVDFVNKDGSYTSLEINSMISYRDGKPYEIFGIARDVTERKKAEEELNKTRERYKELFEATNDIVYTMDFEGNFTSVNPISLRISGYTNEEFVKMNLSDCLTPDSLIISKDNLKKKLDGEATSTIYELEFINKDGSLTWLEVNSMFRYKNGKPVDVFGIARNITERKKAEEELNRTREKYRELAESTNDLVYTVDLDQRFSSMHPKCEKILGYSANELIGRNVNDFITPESIMVSDGSLKKKLKGESINTVYEAEFINKNGSITSLEINSMFRYKDGKPYEILGIARNITTRKRITEELKKSEEKYKAIFENAPLGIMTADTNGNIIEINSMMLQLLGSQSSEESKKINLLSYPPLVEMGIADVFKHSIETGESSVTENVYSSKWGKTFNAKAYTKPIVNSSGTVTGFQVMVEDITTEIIAEEQLKESVKEKETLLRELHHRVKNNMQIIISLINMQINESDDELMKDKLRDIQQRVWTMAIIHENLYVSKNLSKINFGEYLQKLANNVASTYSNSNTVDLKVNVSEIFLDLDTAIPCGLIVNEILSNSFKHAFPKEWKGKNGEVYVRLEVKGSKYLLAIGDNGIGLKEHDNNTERNTLGLVLIEILVKQLKGNIKLFSKKGTHYEMELDNK